MSDQVKRARTRRSYLVELGFEGAMWLVNLYEIATRFSAMSFAMAASAVMLFLFVPVGMVRAWNQMPKEAA